MLALALVPIVLGISGTVALTDGVLERGDLARFDPGVTRAVIAARSPALNALAEAITFLGSAWALVPLTVATVVVLGLARRWFAAAMVALGMSLSLTLTIVLKATVGRARPDAQDAIGAINDGYAFPSGHTLNSTVFLALLVTLVWRSTARVALRVAAVTTGMALTLGVGLSRIYLGYHWLTDVLAGWTVAGAILGGLLLLSLLAGRGTPAPRRAMSDASA